VDKKASLMCFGCSGQRFSDG